jgi:hypothetical protein
MDAAEETRYRIQIDATAIPPSAESIDDDDADHLAEVHEILERIESGELSRYDGVTHTRKGYDLCATCYARYVKNPLARESQLSIGFSAN